VKLWIDDQREAPEGWQRARSLGEAEKALRSGRVKQVSLGGSSLLVETVAAALEAGAFTGRIRPLDVDLRGDHATAAVGLERATKHWSTMPPAAPKAKRGKPNIVLRFLVWHILGFASVFVIYEIWHLLRHRTHAPYVAWALQRLR